MSYKAYNDYELLYLVKERNNQLALEILIQKYEKYIYKKAISFFPREKDFDDYFQEGVLCLYKAINSFKDKYNKTFMRYFEVVLNRRFINIYHKRKREHDKSLLLINEAIVNEQEFHEVEKPNFELNVKLGSKKEELVYLYYYQQGKSVDYLCQKMNLNKKQAYNAIYRVKQKLKVKIKK